MPTPCPHCGAPSGYAACEARWHALLALDHSHEPPWGPAHGTAFATWTLQHSALADKGSVARSLEALTRIVDGKEDQAAVFEEFRARGGEVSVADSPPVKAPREFTVTIHDLKDFPAGTYVADLRLWAAATLTAWKASDKGESRSES